MFWKTGKIQNIVFYERFGKRISRIYFLPKNPKTMEQQKNRYRFLLCTKFAQNLPDGFLFKYWPAKGRGFGGYHSFIRTNMAVVKNPFDFQNVLTTSGNFEKISSVMSAIYVSNTGRVSIQWDTSVFGDGAPGDKVVIVIASDSKYLPYEKKYTLYVDVNFSHLRGDGGAEYFIRKNLGDCFLHCYVSCCRDIAGDVLCSKSVHRFF